MKRMLSIAVVGVAALCVNLHALDPETGALVLYSGDNQFAPAQFEEAAQNKSDLYVVILELDRDGYIISPEYMSLEDYAKIIEQNGGEELKKNYPRAAFALVRYDGQTGKLFPTDPAQEIKKIKRYDPNWYNRDVRIAHILKKTGSLFLKAFEVTMLWACWTTSYVLIPGSQEVYQQGSNLVDWLREHYFTKEDQEGFVEAQKVEVE